MVGLYLMHDYLTNTNSRRSFWIKPSYHCCNSKQWLMSSNLFRWMDMKSDCLLLLKLGMRQTRCFDWLQNQIYGVLKLCALGNPAGDYWLVILQFSKNRTAWKLDNVRAVSTFIWKDHMDHFKKAEGICKMQWNMLINYLAEIKGRKRSKLSSLWIENRDPWLAPCTYSNCYLHESLCKHLQTNGQLQESWKLNRHWLDDKQPSSLMLGDWVGRFILCEMNCQPAF